MASYLLLRNNKESGPYSLEALIQLGLKPYDLVWVEGRSAAWRYPSEVDDLKFYAPVVEEQPYDRFYKKPSQEKKEIQEPVVQQVKPIVIIEAEQKNIQEVNQDTNKIEIKTPKKQVFISMPANSGKTVFIKRTEEVKATAVATSANDIYNANQNSFKNTEPVSNSVSAAAPSYTDLVDDYNSYHSTDKKIPANEKLQASDQSSLETKYSQSLDDIKDIYVQTLVDRKRKTAQRKMTMVLVKKVLPFAAVLIVGFMMGIFMMNKKTGKEIVSSLQPAIIPKSETAITKPDASAANNNNQLQQQTAAQATPQENKTVADPVTDPAKTGDTKKDIVLTDKQNSIANPAANTKKNSLKENKTAIATGNTSTVLTQPKNIEPDPTTGERNKIVRTTDADNNNQQSAPAHVSNTAWKQVSVKSNEYKRGTFGGIHDLQLTVTNNTNYLLDNVVVELQYLKPSNEALKTDNVRFSPIPPNGSLTLAIAPTTRGVKVAYKIIHVESKAAANDTAGLK